MNEQYSPVGQNGQSGQNAKLNMNIGKRFTINHLPRDPWLGCNIWHK